MLQLAWRTRGAATAEPVGWSNSTEPLNGGWPSYEFGDGTTGVSGILRQRERGAERDVVVAQHRGHAELLTVEFQDALNGYQQDSYDDGRTRTT